MKYKVGDQVMVKPEVVDETVTITEVWGEDDAYHYKSKTEAGAHCWLRESDILGVVKDAEVEFPNFYEDSKTLLAVKVWLTGNTSETFVVYQSLWDELVCKGYHDAAMYGAMCFALDRVPKAHDSNLAILVDQTKCVKPELSKMVWEHSGRGDHSLQTIKFIRQCYGIGQKEAKELWDSVKAQES